MLITSELGSETVLFSSPRRGRGTRWQYDNNFREGTNDSGDFISQQYDVLLF